MELRHCARNYFQARPYLCYGLRVSGARFQGKLFHSSWVRLERHH